MQASSTARQTLFESQTVQSAVHSRPARRTSRLLTRTKFQPSSDTSSAPTVPVGLRQSSGAANQARDDPAIPAPQEMQASVMLVPKETATQRIMKQASAADSPLNSFLVKCRLAWNLFFPPQDPAGHSTRELSPKELGKQRLSMILVADRCGLSPSSLVEMKRSTLAALQDCMDLEDLQDAHLRFTMTRENGCTYSMAVPILRPDPYTQDVDDDAVPDDIHGMATSTASWEEEEEAELTQDSSSSTLHGGLAESQEGSAAVQQPAASATLEGRDTPDAGLAGRPAMLSARAPSVTPTEAQSIDSQQAAGAPSPTPASGMLQGSRAGSRGGSPVVEIPLEGTAVMTPDMLKELLVEELVHDVEELVEHMGPAVCAVDGEQGVLVISAAAADDVGSAEAEAAAAAAGVLTEQLEAAVAEVQHFGEPGPSSAHGTTAAAGQAGVSPGQEQTV